MPKSDRFKNPVAAIHTHFNIFRDVHEAHEGPVTTGEQLKAMDRMVRWHTRQVTVCTELRARLMRQLEAEVSVDLDAMPAAEAKES